MSLKKSRVIAVIGSFILSFIFHFAYELFPNFIFSIIFPVNESVWEHMKILYSSIVFYGIIDYFIGKKFNLKYNNFLFNLCFCSFVSILIYLGLFLPIYYKIGESMFLSISILLITYIIVCIISYYILKSDEFDYNYVWIILLLIGYIVFGYLTYHPVKNQLFFDTHHEIYGIKKRN
ncbi:MAG: DUF6512 family protein [Bacilli bacterium]